jgi:hypothetical protein
MTEQTPSIFGSDYKGRKNLPLYFFLVRYFPKALVEVMKVCIAGNVQHNPELDPTDINWSRGKSTDQLNTAQRHLFDHALSGKFDEEPEAVKKILGGNTRHLAKAAWRILAQLELDIEEEQKAGPKAGIRDTSQPLPAHVIQQNCKCGDRVFAYNKGDLPPQVVVRSSSGAMVMHSPNGCGDV